MLSPEHLVLAGQKPQALQKTSGAAIRSLMEDMKSENRFEVLNLPLKKAQPEPGNHTLLSSLLLFIHSYNLCAPAQGRRSLWQVEDMRLGTLLMLLL
jgi:hypothetical protein